MKEVLLVSIAFSPNIGGIETHFDNLVDSLNERGWKVFVLTYKPITINIPAKFYERRNSGLTEIFRLPSVSGLFYKFLNSPTLEFLFLAPALFVALPLLLLTKAKYVKTIHSHGLVAGFVSVFWGKIFSKRVLTTTHSIYHFPKNGFYRNFSMWIFTNSDNILCLSRQSMDEIVSLGVDRNKVKEFTYWIDLNLFRPVSSAKKKVGWDKFSVLFVGRLVEEKGILVLLESASKWSKSINLYIAGTGPLDSKVTYYSQEYDNIDYLGKIDQSELPVYYSAADLVIVPSIHEEGFGRVILESLACGTPVIGARRGAIPEAMDESVGIFIEVTSQNISKEIEILCKNPDKLERLKQRTRKYAEKRYSETNVQKIVDFYKTNS